MVWLERMIRRLTNVHLTDVALEIATRVRLAAWEQIADRILPMPTAEARGYVRARVARIVRYEVDRVLRLNSKLKPHQRPQLVQLATVAVIDQAMIDAQKRHEAAQQQRRAA